MDMGTVFFCAHIHFFGKRGCRAVLFLPGIPSPYSFHTILLIPLYLRLTRTLNLAILKAQGSAAMRLIIHIGHLH